MGFKVSNHMCTFMTFPFGEEIEISFSQNMKKSMIIFSKLCRVRSIIHGIQDAFYLARETSQIITVTFQFFHLV